MADDDDFAGGAGDDTMAGDEFAIAGEEIDAAEVEGQLEEAAKHDPLVVLLRHHPECNIDYAESVASKITLAASPPFDKDPNHRSVPFLTQYEKTQILGFRAKQLSQEARPYIAIPEHVTDVFEIARLELMARRLPFIIRRPMPNGTHEYWRLSDLLIL